MRHICKEIHMWPIGKRLLVYSQPIRVRIRQLFSMCAVCIVWYIKTTARRHFYRVSPHTQCSQLFYSQHTVKCRALLFARRSHIHFGSTWSHSIALLVVYYVWLAAVSVWSSHLHAHELHTFAHITMKTKKKKKKWYKSHSILFINIHATLQFAKWGNLMRSLKLITAGGTCSFIVFCTLCHRATAYDGCCRLWIMTNLKRCANYKLFFFS